ncbi:hypothetical protein F383_16104 [Gossypium arboreum]|uniref:Uncharacterized protein n=1 Tax=Gossypium arboreum TaxID=29729 RepID=A0A0B0PZD8_GOSAR|nr:hypothetical protein F383_16104 [Gossypium arboreum]
MLQILDSLCEQHRVCHQASLDWRLLEIRITLSNSHF